MTDTRVITDEQLAAWAMQRARAAARPGMPGWFAVRMFVAANGAPFTPDFAAVDVRAAIIAHSSYGDDGLWVAVGLRDGEVAQLAVGPLRDAREVAAVHAAVMEPAHHEQSWPQGA